MILSIDTSYTEADRRAFQEKVGELVDAAAGMSDLEAALFFHDYLVTHIYYTPDSERESDGGFPSVCHNAYGALMNGDAVCQGYALAYKLLLDETDEAYVMGLECTTVSSDQLNHMWNAIRFYGDNHWYYVDATWDDPAPDKLSRSRHRNFLLSEKSLEETGHRLEATDDTGAVVGYYVTDWCDTLDNDDSTKYESGWAFNEVDTALYCWDGAYYSIRNDLDWNTDNATSALYRGTLQAGEDTQPFYKFVKRNGSYIYNEYVYSVVWVDGKAYCLGSLWGDITCVDLDSGTAMVVGTVEPSQSNGLRYNAEENTIEVWTDMDERGERSQVASFPVLDYPPEWDNAAPDTTALVGTAWSEDALQVGLVWAEDAGTEPLLLAGFYDRDGRLRAVRTVNASGLEAGLNVLTLESAELPEEWDRAALFLLDGQSLRPLAGSGELES